MTGFGITGTIFCDNAERDRITELSRRGLKTLPADKDVKNGILKVKSMHPYITSNSADFIKEIRSYKFKVDKDGYPHSPGIHITWS